MTDLTQVAVIELIKAVDGFDATRGAYFSSYATPTILGGIKRHFRDTTWMIRVPRGMQELKARMAIATEDIAQLLRQTPTTTDLAARLQVTARDVHAAMLCANAYRAVSLDRPLTASGLELRDVVGELDPRIEALETRGALRLGLAGLSERERRIVSLRFFADMSQSQIGAEIGISQMHVSRLLSHALIQLREQMRCDDDSRP